MFTFVSYRQYVLRIALCVSQYVSYWVFFVSTQPYYFLWRLVQSRHLSKLQMRQTCINEVSKSLKYSLESFICQKKTTILTAAVTASSNTHSTSIPFRSLYWQLYSNGRVKCGYPTLHLPVLTWFWVLSCACGMYLRLGRCDQYNGIDPRVWNTRDKHI